MTVVYADPATLWERLLNRVRVTDSGCWVFTGSTNSRGYGLVCSGRKGKNILTHRLAVIVRDGGIPDGMTVDHQCHDSHTCRLDADCPHRRCVNPAHLKVMTQRENTSRQFESGLCPKGHELSLRNDGRRRCATCAKEYARTLRADRSKRMAAIVAKRTP